jgi:hypothetical protein
MQRHSVDQCSGSRMPEGSLGNRPWYAHVLLPPPSCMSLCILQKAGQFLDLFRHNLMDIDVDPRPYGTHSFRRGGAQFLHHVRRWSIIKVCDWGGWSKDNDAQSTIFKYLLSWNDSPHHTRREMLHPSPPLEDRCHTCNRNCNCH